MDIQGYVGELRALYASGQTTEHSFRPALAKLFSSIDPSLTVINEPKHITDVGAPDFVFNRGEVAVGWCEAKDIGKNIRKFAANDYSKAQKERYRKGLRNLIYTNGLDFEFISDGDVVDFITIADLAPSLPPRPDNFVLLENRLRDFAHATPLTITSSKRLAELMAGKAAIIKDIMARALLADFQAAEAGAVATDLMGQYEAFKANLIHDITVADFADVYAETIAYGLFAARLHDASPQTFTRAEALELLPKSNPFLRELFIYIAGPNLDDRLRRVIDELCNVFCAADMARVLANFGKITARQDPFLHFYEVFLAEYNPAKRKARGVWYTPEPVVNFIVRAVDSVLKTEFGLADGLADTSRVVIDWDTGQNRRDGKAATIKKQVHRVQILDPATGTGTFLAEVVKLVSDRVKGVAPAQWSKYVEHELIPRISGFELLMASYAMCHTKLDMILTGLGYKPSARPPRFGVYLTNSLEEGERVEQTLFGLSRAIAEEAKAASDIKRQMPIMCVIGNPPYSGISQNNGSWISGKIEDYKYVDGVHFGERKHWLQDDYVKFLRFAEHMIEKNGEGVVGFITNHGYLSNPTFRGMRRHLLDTFDKIWVLDLHGNANKGERTPDGFADQNVFDIRQGVAIIIAVKRRGKKTRECELVRSDLWGDRSSKQAALWSDTPPEKQRVESFAPYYMFYNISRQALSNYDAGFSLADLFKVRTVGAVTGRDDINVSFSLEEARSKIQQLTSLSEPEARRLFGLSDKDARDWTLETARKDAEGASDANFTEIEYRPFDRRYTCYTGQSRGLYASPQAGTLRNLLDLPNIGLAYNKTIESDRPFSDGFVFGRIIQHHSLSIKEVNYIAPLYIYPGDMDLDQSIRVNFDPKIYAKICKAAKLSATAGPTVDVATLLQTKGEARPNEIKVFDYIYGVLHCPEYRETYAEFLRIAFPRIPFPTSAVAFAEISAAGEQLRRLHLLEDVVLAGVDYPFESTADDGGSSVVDKPRHESERVWINNEQYFDHVPAVAWNYRIGSYQPARKWLDDRKGRVLGWDDVRHYQKIVRALVETDRIARQIRLPING